MNVQKIIDLYTKHNKSTYEIAIEFDTYPNKIRRILMKNGVDLKNKSEAQKNAIKNGKSSHPTMGKTRSEEEKLNISRGIKQYWNEMDEKTYNSKVDKAKLRWKNMPENEKIKMLEAAIKAIQAAGKQGSKLEKYLYEELTKAGYIVEFHKKYLIQNENLEIDMYIPSLKTIIEVDGPSHFLPIWGEEKLQKQIKADNHKTGLILSKGLAIVRIKNLSDSVCLADKEKLRLDLLKTLSIIEKSFPPKSKRNIEIEI